MSQFKIHAQFHNYWHIGTGRGSGYHLDALVEKDAHGLPYVPGKTLKGLFRDACYKLNVWGHSMPLEMLFGIRADATDESRNDTSVGALRFSSLELIEKDYLAQDTTEIKSLRNHLFSTLSSTAIDEETGIAKDQSLRMIEVVVPVTVVGEIELLHDLDELDTTQIKALLNQAASLITHIGANKTRGFGAVTLEIE